jgi:type II secretory pathway pseudopilin PulG
MNTTSDPARDAQVDTDAERGSSFAVSRSTMSISPGAHSETPGAERGLTMIELIVVLGILIIGFALAIPVTMAMVRNARSDSAALATSAFLEAARNRAVAERRNMQLTFGANNILVQRVEVPGGALTTVDQLTLEGEEEFDRFIPGLPDTPDAFGGAGDVNWTGPGPVMFTSDGSLIDAAGDVTNGTVFVGREGSPETQRAVTIFGVTGVMRTWKWRGTVWQR